MTKHTPGPWNWHGPYMTGGYKVSALNERDQLQFRCYLEPSESPETVEANARLIATAPELLEALREIATGNYERGTMIGFARAAIAKAAGDA